ncbi:HNH endonuclease [Bacillus thuringiensis]|uniref:HNH endonuclease n=1 Tax=Bacillus thuringiensis TaxID=1428 RepID=UPI0030CA2AD8
MIFIEDESHSFDAEITETEKEQVNKSRIGHSTFKNALLAVEKKCRLCGLSDERFLVASHFKPWSQSNHKERLDVNNGLLLCPNHDSLFDKGYISFDDDGAILISNSLDETSRIFLNISDKLRIQMNEIQLFYMKWHRESVFKAM